MRDIAGLIATALLILEILIFIRVMLSWVPTIDYWNPAVRALRTVVDPVLAPFRRVLPLLSGIDLSPLLAIVVIEATRNALSSYSDGFIPSATILAADIVQRLIDAMLVIFIILALLRILISVFKADPWHPTTRMIRDLSRPVVAPFAALAPRRRGVDVAAVIAIVVFIISYKLIDELFGRVIYPALT